jgi:N4-gp56 family major capsid protein
MSNNTSTTTGIVDQYQRTFSKVLLERLIHSLVLNQWAQKKPLPSNAGSKTIRFTRYGEAKVDNIVELTEGVTPDDSTNRVLETEKVDADLVQFGEILKFTDILSATELFNNMKEGTTVAGEDSALFFDQLIGKELASLPDTGSKVTRYAAGTQYSDVTPTSPVTAVMFLDIATGLKKNKCPKIGGYYIGVVAPEVSRDVMRDTDWLEAAKYSNVMDLYNGEVGKLYGVRFVETTNPYRSTIRYTAAYETGEKISSFVFGREAYGVPELSKGDISSPFAPKMLIADGADKSDPLNQRKTLGWKSFYTATQLQAKWIGELYSGSGYVAAA